VSKFCSAFVSRPHWHRDAKSLEVVEYSTGCVPKFFPSALPDPHSMCSILDESPWLAQQTPVHANKTKIAMTVRISASVLFADLAVGLSVYS
jgi:hypothetical protein